jgi:hypothetical protein
MLDTPITYFLQWIIVEEIGLVFSQLKLQNFLPVVFVVIFIVSEIRVSAHPNRKV